jgi:hypothetical protein
MVLDADLPSEICPALLIAALNALAIRVLQLAAWATVA